MPLFRKQTERKRLSRITSALRRIDIPATSAMIGMHVVGLDRPWEQVPVLFQSFVIEKPEQINILRTHCQWITIERTGYLENAPTLNQGAKDFAGNRTLAEELPNASHQFRSAQAYIDSLLQEVADGRDLSVQAAREIVRECVTSIANNPNAMFWLSRIRHRDAYTAEHCVRVGLLAITFGRFIGLPEKQLEVLGLSGMLHDVGKMRIPSEILNKPGALSPQEWAEMRRHAEYGFKLLGSEYELEAEVREAALSHHERLDGKGYPQSLNAYQISQTTRIITIVDAYDAMTSDRAYREGIPSSEALRILYNHRSNQFDEELVEQFIRMIGIYPPGSLVELNTGEIAVVLASGPRQKLLPVVEVVMSGGLPVRQPRVFDLSTGPSTPEGEIYAIAKALPDGHDGFSLSEHIRRLSTEPSARPKPAPR